GRLLGWVFALVAVAAVLVAVGLTLAKDDLGNLFGDDSPSGTSRSQATSPPGAHAGPRPPPRPPPGSRWPTPAPSTPTATTARRTPTWPTSPSTPTATAAGRPRATTRTSVPAASSRASAWSSTSDVPRRSRRWRSP